jgi:voltage-gated potassium channel
MWLFYPRRILLTIMVPTTLLLIGAVGYMQIEGWTFFDSLYMSVTTLATVGYGETHPLSHDGRLFTILYIIGGVFTLAYSISELIRGIVSGEFHAIYGKRSMQRTLSAMKNHVIVCGFGRMGRLVCQEFERENLPYVVIDKNEAILKELKGQYGIPVDGDATKDEILRIAGVARAKSLVVVLPSNADNLYIALSARVLNNKLHIIARAEDDIAEAKLIRVGANQVIAPYVIGGHRIVQAVLRPTVGLLIEQALRPEIEHYQIEELLIEDGSLICGTALRDSKMHEELGIVALAIKLPSGDWIYNPQGHIPLEAGCILVVVGHTKQLALLEEKTRSSRDRG